MLTVALVVVLIPFTLLALRTEWSKRIFNWLQSLVKSDVEDKEIRFSDFVGLAGFTLALIGIVMGWYTANLQNRRTDIQSQIRETSDRNAALQQTIRDDSAKQGQKDFTENVDLHLQAPVGDAALIGENVPDLEWQYSKHTDRIHYLIQMIKADSPLNLADPDPGTTNAGCDFSQARRCTFYASDPTAQRSEVALSKGSEDSLQGRFLWRVRAARASDSGNQSDEPEPLSEWSEYESFAIYPSLPDRVDQRGVMVGTTYSDNVHFSTIGATGKPHGYDIDLINLVVEGCLDLAAGRITYDSTQCYAAAQQYKDPNSQEARAAVTTAAEARRQDRTKPIRTRIVAFPSVEAGLAAVATKQVDVFIGAVTRAAEREVGLRFSDGYYPFRSALYARRSSGAKQSLKDWSQQANHTVGVIGNSTNHWLATALRAEVGGRISVEPYPSWPNLKDAFIRRDVDGILIDDVIGDEFEKELQPEIVRFEDLRQTQSYGQYQKRLKYGEAFAMAIAAEPQPNTLAQRWIPTIRDLFYLPEVQPPGTGIRDLYAPIQAALRSLAVQEVLPEIKHRNHLDL